MPEWAGGISVFPPSLLMRGKTPFCPITSPWNRMQHLVMPGWVWGGGGGGSTILPCQLAMSQNCCLLPQPYAESSDTWLRWGKGGGKAHARPWSSMLLASPTLHSIFWSLADFGSATSKHLQPRIGQEKLWHSAVLKLILPFSFKAVMSVGLVL